MHEPEHRAVTGWTPGLFDHPPEDGASVDARIELAPGAWFLPGFAAQEAADLMATVEAVAAQSPFRHMHTPGGHRMSVAMTNCGIAGWIADDHGYRYSSHDPTMDRHWPALPEPFVQLADKAATAAGFPGFEPNACVINRYEPGARMSLHQDRNEQDLAQPIVSVSLGLRGVFQLGGFERSAPTTRRALEHGDVVVWGGPSRMRFHGVLPIEPGRHPVAGSYRYNLTFRVARRASQ